MRILYHHRTLGDGAEGLHIAEMVAAFRRLGHDVHVQSLAATGSISQGRHVFASNLKRALPAAAFEMASVASNAPDFIDVQKTISRMRPDFLYKRHARFDVGAVYAARRAGVPTVLEVNCLFAGASYHQFEPIALRRVAARFERLALTRSDVVLAVSTPLATDIQRTHGVSAVVMANGADPHRFDPARADGARVRSRFECGEAVTVVGWAGVIRKWHGLELLIDALSMTPDLRLLIVGDGPARAEIERYADCARLGRRLVITGRVPAEQMPDHVAAMDIAVVADDGTGVASPMKLLEYMSMARAVVAPALENIRDIVTDSHDGLLFTPGDRADLATQLRRLGADADLRHELGRRARGTILRSRNWRCNAERVVSLVDAHRQALESGGAAPGTTADAGSRQHV